MVQWPAYFTCTIIDSDVIPSVEVIKKPFYTGLGLRQLTSFDFSLTDSFCIYVCTATTDHQVTILTSVLFCSCNVSGNQTVRS